MNLQLLMCYQDFHHLQQYIPNFYMSEQEHFLLHLQVNQLVYNMELLSKREGLY